LKKHHSIKYLAIVLIALFFISCNETLNEKVFVNKTPFELVNPFIGTGGHGHTYPGATLPFGMVQLSPDTRLEGWDGCSGYHYSDSIIYGFSHTHLSGTGVSDYGDVLVMPTQGKVQFDNGYKSGADKGYASWFKKETEKASPGYYEVKLAENDIDVRLTTTERVGIHEYTFNKEGDGNVIIDLEHRDKLISSGLSFKGKNIVEGFRISNVWAKEQHLYFVLETSKDFIDYELNAQADINRAGSTKVALKFDLKQGEKVVIKVGISAVSIEGARKNLEAEAPHWDFEKYKDEAKTKWEKALNKIEVKGTKEDNLTIFYSALYHTMIAPNVFSDVTGEYRGMDMQIHKTDNTEVYTIFSLWDTFRAAHPLYTIIEQDKTNAFINTFLAHYHQGGRLPVWELAGNETDCMIGYHAVSVIADAYIKGIRGYDTEKALEAMQHSASLNHLGLSAYKAKGYIGSGDEAESVSKTLEYAYDDWCIAIMAKDMGKQEVYSNYIQRAQNYKNLFNPITGFMQSKMNGTWSSGFNPAEVNFNFTEANSWQYSMFAPQDISGLIKLYGGEDKFEQKLDDLFSTNMELSGRHQVDITGLIGQYAHGNEPSHHMAYLYNYIGKPWKTQQKVNQILNEQYQNKPDGLSGNEDCGQMSAWYVLSAMGFYSVTPGLNYYTIGTPHFNESTIHLENGNKFQILAKNLTESNIYIQSAMLNGKKYTKSFLNHQDIMNGGELVFEMGKKPNLSWGNGIDNIPKSEIDEKYQITCVPYFVSTAQVFTDSLKIEMKALNNDDEVFYKTSSTDFIKYENPVVIKESTDFTAYAVNKENKSFEVQSSYKKIKGGRTIELKTGYSNQYNAGGNNALINSLKGSNNYRTGNWQGYNNDVIAIVDLGKIEEVGLISLGALQDIQSWIFYPKTVKISVSLDNKTFKPLTNLKNDFPDNKYGAFTKEYTYKTLKKISARYVKVEAENYGLCPDWHLGHGGQTMLFVDEILVE